jgi:hypothetical protein
VQLATPATAPLRLVACGAALAAGRIGLRLDQARELVELGERGGELQLQLGRVDALGLRDSSTVTPSSVVGQCTR